MTVALTVIVFAPVLYGCVRADMYEAGLDERESGEGWR